MSTQAPQRTTMAQAPDVSRSAMHQRQHEMSDGMANRRQGPMKGSETKPSVRSTEFWIYLLAVAGTLLASQLVGRNADGVDIFRADKAWWYIALLTIGYLGSRGLAKAGSSWRNSGG